VAKRMKKYQFFKEMKKLLQMPLICAIMSTWTLTACVKNGSDPRNSALCTLEPIFYDAVEPYQAEIELLKHNEVICGICKDKKSCEVENE